MLSKTRFRPEPCVVELNDLEEIPCNSSLLLIVGIEETQDSICQTIRTKFPHSVIVAVGDQLHVEDLRRALDNGANAAVLSSVSPATLVRALNSVVSGPVVVIDRRLCGCGVQQSEEPSLALALTKQAPLLCVDVPLVSNVPLWTRENDPQPFEHLSAREIAVLERIVQGDSNKHVAHFYKITESAVKAHLKAIFRKVGASNRTQAAMWALNHGLINICDAADQLPPSLQCASGDDSLQTDTLSVLKTRILKRAAS